MGEQAMREVLEGVMKVGYGSRDNQCPESFPFPACMASAMRYMGEDYPWVPLQAHGKEWRLNMANVQFLGATGMAFALLWSDELCLSCTDLTQINEHNDTIDRAFQWAGYEYEIMEKAEGQQEVMKQRIKESINNNRPVLAFGVIGPPECCIITGYDNDGEVLIGWSYFQRGAETEPGGQFRKADWHKDTWKIVLIGKKTERTLTNRQALAHGLKVLNTTEASGYRAGFAAYDAWIQYVSNDAVIESAVDDQLKKLHHYHHLLIGSHAEARSWCSAFLRHIAEEEPAVKSALLEAASCFKAIHDLMWDVWGALGGARNPDAWLKFRESEARKEIARVLGEARKKEEEAVRLLTVL